MTTPNKNQPPKQQKLKDLNEIKQLKSNSLLKTINLMINQCLYYKDNYYESEETIAKRLGVSSKTVYRAIKKARALGIISRRRRFNMSNIYAINPELRDPKIVEELASILPALRGLLCLAILIPLTMICQASSNRDLLDSVQLYKKKEILRLISVVQKETQYEEIKKKTLQREARYMDNNPHAYGGTKLYDRKTSQIELDLLARAREKARKKYGMQIDNEAQPRYNDVSPRKSTVSESRKQAYNAESPYAPYVPVDRPAEDPIKASERLINWTQDKEKFNKFVALVGEEVALNMCNKIVTNALEEMK